MMNNFDARANQIVLTYAGHPALKDAIAAALREAHAAGMNQAASLADPYMPQPGRGQYLAEVLEFTSTK